MPSIPAITCHESWKDAVTRRTRYNRRRYSAQKALELRISVDIDKGGRCDGYSYRGRAQDRSVAPSGQ
jgi:hypothetical protein